jgi:CDP-diacylglycerol--serine O-phosphatidyltransferase
MIIYHLFLASEHWAWVAAWFYIAGTVVRLARFNVEQAGRKKTYFHGLPSPAAGLTLATYYWFSQTERYSQTVILFTDDKTLKDLPWQTLMSFLMAILAALMISNVPYPAFPPVGYKTTRQRLGSVVVIGSILGLILVPKEFIFPACIAYVLYGIVKYFVFGLLGKTQSPDEIYWSGDSVRAPQREMSSEPRPPRSSRPSRPSVPSAPPAPPANGVLVEDDGGVDRVSQRDERDRSQRRRRRRRGGRGSRPDRPDRGSSPSSSSEPPPDQDQ